MKISRGIALACLTVMALLFFVTSHGIALTLQPWTTAETSLFDTRDWGDNEGSGWFGNTLVLNYGDDLQSATLYGYSTTGFQIPNFIPADAIGIYFDYEHTTVFGTATIGAYGYSEPGNPSETAIVECSISTNLYGPIDFRSVIQRPPGYKPIYGDIPESIEDGVTTVSYIFIQDIMDAPFLWFWIEASNYAVGTTTFSDMSWIIDDGTIPFPDPVPAPVPEPSTILLVATGLLGLAGFRKKFKK